MKNVSESQSHNNTHGGRKDAAQPRPARPQQAGRSGKKGGSKEKPPSKEQPPLRLDTFEGFLETLEAMQGVRTVYVTPQLAPPDLLCRPGILALLLTAKDEQNHVARCLLALDVTEIDLHANREEALPRIEARVRALELQLEAAHLDLKRGQWC